MELITPAVDTLKSLDWHAILFIAGLALLGWAAFLTLSGLEGWILASSLSPWFRGLIFGAALVAAGMGMVLFGAMGMPQDNQAAWIGLAVAAGIGGLIAAHVTVVVFWRTWWLRIFLFGGFLGLLIYLGGLSALAVSEGGAMKDLVAAVIGEVVEGHEGKELTVNWLGVAKLAAAFVAGGGIYSVAYRLFYPLLWLLRNGTLLAIGVILVAVPDIREALASFAEEAADAQDLVDAASERNVVLVALAGGSYLIVAYMMWIQHFSRKFRNFSGAVLKAEYGSFGLATMIGCSVETAFSTVGRMLVLKRSASEGSRLITEEEEEEEDQEAEHPRKGKHKHAKEKSAGKKH